MTVSRTLPVEIAARFAAAPRAVIRSEDLAVEVLVAERFALRLRGLTGLGAGELVPLLLPRCRSLHTFGMRAPIDIVWLDLEGDGSADIVAVEPGVGANRFERGPRALKRRRAAALELGAGDAVRLGLVPGAHLELRGGVRP